ncbi:SH3 domain-containing protein [Niallia sp. Krafla_26]|uniref:SH3 domain-containing protein n=1 Tax=Niallia sp. Krafla_26 TaxID=3064703 RepID=UPI003D17EB38
MKKVILPGIAFAVLSTPAFEKAIEAAEQDGTSVVSNTIQYVKVNSGSLNMRESASTSASIITNLKNGTEVNVQSVSNGWAEIVVNGQVGYVSTKYLTTKSSEINESKELVESTAAQTATTTKFVKVSAGSYLNMRTSASTTSSVISRLSSGTEVTVFSEKNGWAKIKADGKEGYVSTGYLSNTKIESTTKKETAQATTSTINTYALTKFVDVSKDSYLNMRSNPSTTSKVVTKLKSGTEVKVLSDEHGWSKIEADGKQGYVSSKYLAGSKAESSTASAPTATATSTKYVDVSPNSYLNMRSSASTSASVVAKLQADTVVEVYTVANGWAKIKANGKEGYVSAEFLKEGKSNTPAPAPTAQATETKYVDVSPSSYLNMRSSASTGASVVAKLQADTAVEVYTVVNGWAKIKVDGKEGYVSAEYLKAGKSNTPVRTPAPTAPTSETKYVDVSPSSYLNMRSSASTGASVVAKLQADTAVEVYSVVNGWAKIKVDGKEGYVSAEYLKAGKSNTPVPTPTAPKTETQYVKVSENSYLNMRTSASTSASVVTKLRAGEAVEVYSISNGWAKIQVNGKEGYVSADYLAKTQIVETNNPTPTKPEEKTTTMYVNVDSRLNLRSAASTSSNILGRLENGMAVTVYSTSNGWSKIKVDGKEGYVSSEYLTETNPQPEPAPSNPNPETTLKYVDVQPGSHLNMRNRPSTSGSVIVKLAPGIEVTVLSEEDGWAKIKAYGQEGYVSTEYLSSVKPGTGQETEEPKEPENPDIGIENPNPETDPSDSEEDPTAPNDSEPGSETDPDDSTNEDSDLDPDENKPDGETGKTNLKYVNVSPNSVLNMRSGPSTSTSVITKLSPGTAVTVLTEENGWSKVTANAKTGYVSTQYLISKANDIPSGNINVVYTDYDITLEELTNIQMQANPQTDQKYTTYIREDALKVNNVLNPTSGVVQGSNWRVRGGAGTEFWSVGKVKNGEKVNIRNVVKGSDGYNWYQIDYNRSWVTASPEDVAYQLDPENFLNDPVASFQFLKLSEATGVDQFEVNERILSGKGILQGHAATFIAASEKYGVNDMYLISHALLETGNGKSKLATGVEIYGKTVYNMFGIGAYDGSAVESGAKFAYEQGWFTPVEAIIGGAKFIASSYISKGQDTVYKMRWNPEAAANKGVATHQYATDIGWASKQVKQIHNLYSLLDSYKITLDIPFYRKF